MNRESRRPEISHPRKLYLATVAASAAVVGCGCGNVHLVGDVGVDHDTSSHRSASAYVVSVLPPRAPEQLQNTTFDITVSRRAGLRPVHGAHVVITLTMPSMPMPPQLITCREIRPGYYEGVGTFTMTGEWQVAARAIVPSGKRADAVKIVDVR